MFHLLINTYTHLLCPEEKFNTLTTIWQIVCKFNKSHGCYSRESRFPLPWKWLDTTKKGDKIEYSQMAFTSRAVHYFCSTFSLIFLSVLWRQPSSCQHGQFPMVSSCQYPRQLGVILVGRNTQLLVRPL